MNPPAVLTIHTDGAARGNPGPAAFAYVIARDGAPPIEEAACMGATTNNVAEYTALVRALEHAERLGTQFAVAIHSDSELMVKQMKGEYRVKSEDLIDLYQQAKKLSGRFASVTFQHVRREKNKRADELCNEALDGRRGPGGKTPAKKKKAAGTKASGPLREAVRAEALTCLGAARGAWARGEQRPSAEEVWDQLWSVLEENGVLRSLNPRSG